MQLIPKRTLMSNTIKIKKGLDIPLEGKATGATLPDTKTNLYAIVPDDFLGYVWKTAVKAGDTVSAGSPLLYAKEDERLCLTSPVSGTVSEIHRGERRKIEFVSVESDGKFTTLDFGKPTKEEEILETLMRSGLFAMIRQRPFDIVPFTNVLPRDIFVTAFDTAPLAGPVVTNNNYANLEAGLKVLSELTDGKVFLGVPTGSDITSRHAEVYEFAGPHPAGNVGTQIAAIKPVNKGETVWTMDARTAARIGVLLNTGKPDYETEVAVTGPEISEPKFINTRIGAALSSLLSGVQFKQEDNVRLISGNVLTGIKVDIKTGFLRWPYRQVTAIEEGDHRDEFMGWASLNPKKFSVKHTFPAFIRGLKKDYDFDTRIKGGHRAMILSGEYDKVFPMDIYPEYLIKAIMAKDIEKMEQLGIYEVAPEDFALPEFVDTSKLELQKIVRDGLDYLRKETL